MPHAWSTTGLRAKNVYHCKKCGRFTNGTSRVTGPVAPDPDTRVFDPLDRTKLYTCEEWTVKFVMEG